MSSISVSFISTAKEMFGQATGDKSKGHEGTADQSKANLKDAGENVNTGQRSTSSD
ncbi:CsbD family protein [Nocardia vinacea]|uniref:CsbD family protein n=1 Tax=Nocardia vinacea TaxID=96468 RepID=UPI003F4D47BD